MNYRYLNEIPDYAIEDCKSLQKCAKCCNYRLPLALAYTLYHRYSEDTVHANWEARNFNCFTFVEIMNYLNSESWINSCYNNYNIIDNGSFPIELLENPKELNYWIMKIDDK
jgi:hypothetical protein